MGRPGRQGRAWWRLRLPDERHHGLREVQNWAGGSDWHPLDAEFVPPPPEDVRPSVDDLVAYVNAARNPSSCMVSGGKGTVSIADRRGCGRSPEPTRRSPDGWTFFPRHRS